jgi:8-oxo-dGTP diphosphatase
MKPPENPFESGIRKVIPAVLVYVRCGDSILMIHRSVQGVQGKVDFHEGKWNGLGGKCELDESPLEAAQREVKEESGIELPHSLFQALGTLQFPNFKPHKNEDWMVFVFHAEISPSEKPYTLPSSAEGELHWIPIQDILTLNLWPGDRYFIPYVLEQKAFMGTLWYKEKEVIRHWMTLIGSDHRSGF